MDRVSVSVSTIKEEQKQARGEITSACEILEGVHITLHHQFLELTKNTENLKQRFFCMHEQYHSIDRQTQVQKQSDDRGSSQEPGAKRAKRKLSARGANG